MQVLMKVDLSGSRDGQPWPPAGEPIDLPDDEAAAYCAAGLAEEVTDVKRIDLADPESKPTLDTAGPDEVETATMPDRSEKAVASRASRRKGGA